MTRLKLASLRLQWAQTKAAADCGAPPMRTFFLDPLPDFGVDPLPLSSARLSTGSRTPPKEPRSATLAKMAQASRSGRADMQVS